MLCKKNSVSIIIILLNLISVSVRAQYQASLTIDHDNQSFIDMAITQDGKFIVTNNDFTNSNLFSKNIISLWNAKTGEKLKEVISQHSYLGPILISPNGTKALIGGESGDMAVMWDIQEMKELYMLHTEPTPGRKGAWPMKPIIFCDDGNKVITKDYVVGYRAWDVASGTELPELTKIIKSLSPGSIALWSANNQLLYYYIINDQVKTNLLDMTNMKLINSFDGGVSALSLNKKYLLYSIVQGYCVKDFETNQTLGCRTFIVGEYPDSFDVSNEGLFLIGGYVERHADTIVKTRDRILYNPKTKSNLRVYPINGAVENSEFDNDKKVKFFPDGRRFITINGTKLHIFDISDLTTEVKDAPEHK